MKPIKLVIDGINSYATKQVVDFETLSQTSLFGVFGETGSGKSTILDSIIYALYGSCDRDNKLETFINLNRDSALIEFVFQFENPINKEVNEYKITRTLKKTKSGVKSFAELVNLTQDCVVAEETVPVNKAVFNMLRIGKKEFKRCIALPQGEFDEFLLSTPSEKKASIAKLFDAEVYGKKLLEVWQQRKSVLDDNLNLINAKMVATNYLGDNTVENLENSLEGLKTTKQENLTKLKRLETQLAVTTQEFDNYNKLVDNKNKYNNLILQTEKMELLKNNINAYVKYEEVINVFNELNELDNVINITKNKIEIVESKKDNIEKTIVKKEDSLKHLLQSKIDVSSKLAVLNTKLEQMQNVEEEYNKTYNLLNDNKNTMENLIKDCDDISENVKTKQAKIENLYCRIKAVQNDFNELVENIKTNVPNFVIAKIKQVINLINDFTLNLTNQSINTEILINAKNILLNIIENAVEDYNFTKLLQVFESLEKKTDVYNKEKESLNEVLFNQKTKQEEILDVQKQNSELLNNFVKLKNQVLELKNIKEDYKSLQSEFEVILENEKLFNETVQKENDNLILVNNELMKLKEDFAEISTNYKNKNIEFLKFNLSNTDINKLSEELKNFDKDYAEKVLSNYNADLLLCKKEIENLESLNLREVTKENLKEISDKYEEIKMQNEEVLKSIGKFENEIKNLQSKLEIQERYLKERDLITKKLNVYNDLNKYISKNQLSDFVAEECLQIVTDIANAFMDELSEGKFEILYNDGEFSIVDNFNAGLIRGVKSLSGGERFIVSLCLSLGISRALSKSSNRQFNFLFIDEGFGSLSEKYLSSILECFDNLIRMNFTIGIITHVEKLKDYVMNKIEVEKINSETGSVIIGCN